jgi:hypothetical protein
MYPNRRWIEPRGIAFIMVVELWSGCGPESAVTNVPASKSTVANPSAGQPPSNSGTGSLTSPASAGVAAPIGMPGASAAGSGAAGVVTLPSAGMNASNAGVGERVMAGSHAAAGAIAPARPTQGCGQTLPPITDYGANGPFATTTTTGTGPDGMYTMVRPTTLGDNGFKHPPATWGNGITTTPSLYPGLLGAIASHGIVVIASDSSNVTAKLMTDGLDWLIAQNTTPGLFQGKLDTECAISIGYSLGGGAATNTGSHPKVVTTVSFHGLPGNSAALHGPLLLFTSKMDTFVTADGFVTPNYNASSVQTFYATLVGAGDNGHLTPIFDAGPERAPAIAWLRLWVYGDQAARQYFYGDDCILCKDPWAMPQRKNWP